MKQLIIIVILVCGTFAAVPHISDSRINLRQLRDGTGCTVAGVQCLNCSSLVLCVDLGNGNFQKELLETCNTGTSCSSGVCSDEPDPGCGVGKFDNFACNSIGMFPDPYDCRSFHVCCKDNGALSSPVKCTGNYYYDPVSTYCKLPYVTATGCPQNTKIACNEQGQMGPHPLNKSIYYICAKSTVEENKFYPKFFLCPNGKIFNAGKCI